MGGSFMNQKIVTMALLTGRGNNTLSDKNVRDILGEPVLYYPANAAKKSTVIDYYYCSSDDDKILDAASKIGYQAIVRPVELALPTSQHKDCILHALKIMESENNLPEILVVLLANNVTVKSSWITECVNIMKQDMSISAVVPVYQDNDHHPLRAKRLDENGTLQMYEQNVQGHVSTNRQDLPRCYFLAHNFWVLNVKELLADGVGQPPWDFMGNKIIPYNIDESIDIHSEEDLYLASQWITRNYCD